MQGSRLDRPWWAYVGSRQHLIPWFHRKLTIAESLAAEAKLSLGRGCERAPSTDPRNTAIHIATYYERAPHGARYVEIVQ